MTISQEQITHWRAMANLPPAPPVAPAPAANDIIAQRKAALGMDKPETITETPGAKPSLADSVKSSYDKYSSGVNKVATDIFDPIKQAGTEIADTVSSDKSGIRKSADVLGSLAEGTAKSIAAPIVDVVQAVGDKIGDSKAVQDFATSPTEEMAAQGREQAGEKASALFDSFAQSHPDAAAYLKDAGKTGEFMALFAGDSPAAKDAVGDMASATKGAVKSGAESVKSGIKSAADTFKQPMADLSKMPEGLNEVSAGKIRSDDVKLQDALEATKPTLYKKDTIAAFEKAGTPGGIAENGRLGTYKQTPSTKDLEIAHTVKDFVVKNKPIDSIVNINNEIGRVADQEVTPLLKNNPSAFNLKTLDAHIRGSIDKPDFIKADPILDKTYDLTRQRMLDIVSRKPKTMEGLWDARKEFDSVAQKQLGSLDPTSKEGSVIKQSVLDTRRAVNDFIAENTPNGNTTFKDSMRKLSNMYEARGNIAESNYKSLGKNAVDRWIKANPKKAKALGYGLTFVGGTTAAHELGI